MRTGLSEDSALESLIRKKPDPKANRFFLRVRSTEGQGVGLCWAKSTPKGPNGPHTKGHTQEAGLSCGSFLRKGEVLAYVGIFQILKDIKARNPDFDIFRLGRKKPKT